MKSPPAQEPARLVGRRIEDLDTPALVLDGPASDRNLLRMAGFFRGRRCLLRRTSRTTSVQPWPAASWRPGLPWG